MTMFSSDTSLAFHKQPLRQRHARSFYHLAAALANSDNESLAASHLLESDYQDCLLSFNAQSFRQLDNKITKPRIMNTLNKFIAGRNKNSDIMILSIKAGAPLFYLLEHPKKSVISDGIVFSPQEINALLLWAASSWRALFISEEEKLKTAAAFHHELSSIVQRPGQPVFCLSMQQDFLIHNARLFSANRLSKKSWQINNGARPGIRYYHAALSSPHSAPIDILYWLKFDDNHQITDGEFINNAHPELLSCPFLKLEQWAYKQDDSYAELKREIIALYKASIGVSEGGLFSQAA